MEFSDDLSNAPRLPSMDSVAIYFGYSVVLLKHKSTKTMRIGQHDPNRDEYFNNGTIIQHYINEEEDSSATIRFECENHSGHITSISMTKTDHYEIVYSLSSVCDWLRLDTQKNLVLSDLLLKLTGLCRNLTDSDSNQTFEYCYPDRMRQYSSDGEIVNRLSLGNLGVNYDDSTWRQPLEMFSDFSPTTPSFNEESYTQEIPIKITPTPKIGSHLFVQGGLLQLELLLNNGTYSSNCEKQRVTTVQLRCSISNDGTLLEFRLMEEIEPCEYRALLHTPLVCAHPKLARVIKKSKTIDCHPSGMESKLDFDNLFNQNNKNFTVKSLPDTSVYFKPTVELVSRKLENRSDISFKIDGNSILDEELLGVLIKKMSSSLNIFSELLDSIGDESHALTDAAAGGGAMLIGGVLDGSAFASLKQANKYLIKDLGSIKDISKNTIEDMYTDASENSYDSGFIKDMSEDIFEMSEMSDHVDYQDDTLLQSEAHVNSTNVVDDSNTPVINDNDSSKTEIWSRGEETSEETFSI
eukprot:GHVL01035717.1.p1 GENE.GHVL01035717.1~~GHVL01035717.1.p1  ORF type:complete len:524 (-),score=78.88 GHVL01035717.1:1958-3529(-)